MKIATFPRGFLWGAATSAYQVEGAITEGGRCETIWDRFSHSPGNVTGGDTGDIACDQYHRYPEDVETLRELGFGAYRFSIAWARILPNNGTVNQAGLDYYHRLLDALLAAGIEPFPTLYHWDLPLWVDDLGGWTSRAVIGPFTDYVDIVVRALGDRVRYWSVLNEPQVFTTLGYLEGEHAPGIRDRATWLRATHIVNLAHAAAIRGVRAAVGDHAAVGTVINYEPAYPASDDPADALAAERYHALNNAWFLDPLLHGVYPTAFRAQEAELAQMDIRPGDMDAIRADLDFVGLNHYFRVIVADADNGPEGTRFVPGSGPVTGYGWETHPGGMYRMLDRIRRDYPSLPIYIAENGCSYPTSPGPDGQINDVERIEYLDGYIGQMARAITDGADVRGYFVWSLIDNFEWQRGYSERFGIVWCDFDHDQNRTIKASGRWFADLIRAGRIAFDERLD